MKTLLSIFFCGIFSGLTAQDTIPEKIVHYKNNILIQDELSFSIKNSPNPSHFASIEYGHRFKNLPVIARFNYTNRFNLDATQLEVELYPSLSKKVYCSFNAGYSNAVLFPDYKAGGSVYFTLPKAFEIEGGFRYLHYPDPAIIYLGSLGKYYKRFWFNIGGYFTPAHGKLFTSYVFKTRYYTSDENYFFLLLGKGISPDDKKYLNNIVYNANFNTYTVESGIEMKLSKRFVWKGKIGLLYQQGNESAYSNQFITGLGLKYLF